MFRILKRPNFWVVFLGDAVLCGLAYYLSYILRFDGNIPAGELANWMSTVVWIVPLKLTCFFFFGLYKGMWRYTGIYDLENLIKACVIISVKWLSDCTGQAPVKSTTSFPGTENLTGQAG